jgi:hypothetical protein
VELPAPKNDALQLDPWHAPYLHGAPQAPQLAGSLVSSTQALPHMLSLLELHAATQVVPLQLAVPPVGAVHTAQLAPHALVSLATQLPPQRCAPAVHWHDPPTQCLPLVHAVPQLLQLASSLVGFTHKLPQRRSPLGQAGTHEVPLQLTVPPVGAAQTAQLAPHALSSFATHAPPHRCVPPVHTHALPTQRLPPVHALPQPLQLASLLVRSTQVLPQSAGVDVEHPVTHP